MNLKIGSVFPNLLNLFGDRGNILTLAKRLEWRKINYEILQYRPGNKIDFSRLDIVYIGAALGKEQLLACELLKKQKDELNAYIQNGGVVLAVCGGFELLGHYYKNKEELIEGVALLDIFTESSNKKFVGNIIIKSDFLNREIVGFENHNGQTIIGNNTPLGNVIYGHGNNGKDKTEGVIYKNLFGTNLHGPLLPKNPHLCDYILKKALGLRYGNVDLKQLDDSAELAANEYILKRFGK